MLKYKKVASDLDLFIMSTNMGSCQCGNVETLVVVDHLSRLVTTSKDETYPWKSGKLIKKYNNYEGSTLVINYVFETIIVPEHYRHVVRKFTKLEKALFNNGFTRLEPSYRPYGHKRFARYEEKNKNIITDVSEVY